MLPRATKCHLHFLDVLSVVVSVAVASQLLLCKCVCCNLDYVCNFYFVAQIIFAQ